MKQKHVAAVLSFMLGILGAHRFYLGQRFLGFLYFGLFMFTVTISFEEEAPFVLIPIAIAIIDTVLLAVMPQQEFDRKYNKHLFREERAYPAGAPRRASRREEVYALKQEGIQFFREYDYERAIDAFLDALELAPHDANLHFNLACCYSALEDAPAAYEHLELAVNHGFRAQDKIESHPALAWVRSQPDFVAFREHGYQRPLPALPTPKSDLLVEAQPPKAAEEELPNTEDLLEQIARLGNLRERGILTEEEFTAQKQKLLRL